MGVFDFVRGDGGDVYALVKGFVSVVDLGVDVGNLGGMWVGMQATKYFSSKTTGRDIHSSDSSSRGSSKGWGVDAAAGEESEVARRTNATKKTGKRNRRRR